MPVTFLGIGITVVNKTDRNLELMEAYILVGRKTINKKKKVKYMLCYRVINVKENNKSWKE